MESNQLNISDNNIIVKNKIKERTHEYYMKNRDKLLEKCKIRLEKPENKIKQQEYTKKYLEKNADKYKELKNQKFNCDICGGCYTYSNFNKHIISNKHASKFS